MHTNSKPRNRRLLAIAAISASAATLWPAQAQAQDFLPGIRAYVGYGYSSGTSGVHWGAELWGLGRVAAVNDGPSAFALGPTIQFAVVGLSAPRLVVAAQAAGCVEPGLAMALAGEAGATFRFGEKSGAGIHLGLNLPVYWAFAYARTAILLDEYAVGLGADGPAPSGFVPCATLSSVSGRPLRGTDPQPMHIGSDNAICTEARHEAEALARAWAQDAQEECTAVAAFLQLAAELLQMNAPLALVDRAIHSARQEIMHAKRCASLAAQYDATLPEPVMPPFIPRSTAQRSNALIRLAQESWLDGCLGEGLAAARARHAASHAKVPEAASLQKRIASDEQQHAELGWDVLRWALKQGDPKVAEAVHALRDQVAAVDKEPCPQPLAVEHGRVGAAEMHRLAAQHAKGATTRLDRLLASA